MQIGEMQQGSWRGSKYVELLLQTLFHAHVPDLYMLICIQFSCLARLNLVYLCLVWVSALLPGQVQWSLFSSCFLFCFLCGPKKCEIIKIPILAQTNVFKCLVFPDQESKKKDMHST